MLWFNIKSQNSENIFHIVLYIVPCDNYNLFLTYKVFNMSKLESKYGQNGIIFLVIFSILVNLMQCQMPKAPPIIPLVDDIPYIECDICQKAAKVLYKSVKAKREQISPMKVYLNFIHDIYDFYETVTFCFYFNLQCTEFWDKSLWVSFIQNILCVKFFPQFFFHKIHSIRVQFSVMASNYFSFLIFQSLGKMIS